VISLPRTGELAMLARLARLLRVLRLMKELEQTQLALEKLRNELGRSKGDDSL